MCGLPSCDQFLARLNEIWPDDANPGIRKCGVNSPWEVVGQAVAGLIVLIGLLASAQICRKAHREAELRAAAIGLPPASLNKIGCCVWSESDTGQVSGAL